jgi:hypothetical protein
MKPSKKNVVRKRPGRPATGQDPVTAIRLSKDLRANVDAWARTQDDKPGRSEAIRRLVEIGLAVPARSDRAPRPGRSLDLGQMAKLTPAPKTTRLSRARELAAEAIDKMHDPAASTEERAQRRRRLTKGPVEFREDRVDRPKAKGK